MVPLDFLQDGECGEFIEVTGDPDWIQRMAEVGICVGRTVRVLRQGSPCLIEVGGTRVSVRGEYTMQILVAAHS